MTHAPESRITTRITWGIAFILLLWIIGVVTWSQWQMAPTFDEQNHVTRGISVLRTGDYRLVYHHPPLANILEATPVAWLPNGFSTSMPAWTDQTQGIWKAAQTTIWNDPAQGLRLIHLARIPVLLFTLVLAVVVFLWSKELFGPWGGVLSLLFFALDPNILAHSGLATTDMAATCTIVLAVFLLRRYLFVPSRGRLLAGGLGMGLALAAKFSALILVPITGLILLVIALWPSFGGAGLAAHWKAHALPGRIGRLIALCAVLGVLGGITLWGVYGFQAGALGSDPGKPVAASAPFAQRLPIPALQYLRGLKTVKSEATDHKTYLLGKSDPTGQGWWYYFPVAMAAKTPLVELAAILGMLLLLLTPRGRTWVQLPGREALILLLPPAVFLLAALGLFGISLNLGIRHILPMYPFLLILIGGWARLPWRGRAPRFALGVLIGVQAAAIMLVAPNFLAFFNIAAGGPNNGYRVLVDSNLDWGQDLPALARLQREQHLPQVGFSYFGTTPPEAYGIDYVPLAGFGLMRESPAPDLRHYTGYLAISATNLAGGPDYTGVDYRPLLQRRAQLIGRAGRTIFVYHLLPGE